MRPKDYDKYVLALTLPGFFVSIWFCMMIVSVDCFPYATGRRAYEVFGPVVDPLMIISFVASPLAVFLFGRSSTNRLVSACFMFNGLYILVWIVFAVLFYFVWSAQHQFHD